MGLAYAESPLAEGFAPQLVRIIFHNSTAAVGEGFKVDLHWQNVGDEPSERDYWIFVHFRPEGELDEPYGPGGFSWDFPPARGTSRWRPDSEMASGAGLPGGDSLVKEEGCFFRVPPGVRPGKYSVLIGLYDRDGSLDRIPLQNKSRDVGNNRYRVGTVQVTEEPGQPSKLIAYRFSWRVNKARPKTAPGEARFLTKGKLSVGFDPLIPAIRSWRWNGTELPLKGDPVPLGPEAEFLSLDENRARNSLALGAEWTFNARMAGDTAVYKCRLRWRGREVARFDIRFQLERNGANLRLASVQEGPGFQLVAISVPAVASVAESTKGAALGIMHEGGRLVDIAQSARHREIHTPSRSYPLPAAMVLCNQAIATGWAKSPDDQIITEVLEADADEKYATMGIRFVHRIKGPSPESRFVPRKNSSLQITLASASTNETLTWIQGAELISKNLRARPNPIFTGSLMYRYRFDENASASENIQEARDLFQRVRALSFDAKQVVYLENWQEEGSLLQFTPGKWLGGLKGLEQLRDEASALGVQITITDNISIVPAGLSDTLDRLARQAPEHTPALIFKKGNRAFTALSYRALLDKTVIDKRLDKMMDVLGPCRTVYLKEITSLPKTPDYTIGRESGIETIVNDAKDAIDLYRKRGIEAASDTPSWPFIGLVSHFMDLGIEQEGGPYSMEERIPLTSAVLQTKATWCSPLDIKFGEGLLLLYGSAWTGAWDNSVSDGEICDRYYLVNLPVSLLAGKAYAGFERDGAESIATFEDGGEVRVNTESGAYSMTLNGYRVLENGLATIPVARGSLLVYSTHNRRVELALPHNWPAGPISRVEAAEPDGTRSAVDFQQNKASVILDIPARQPISICRR